MKLWIVLNSERARFYAWIFAVVLPLWWTVQVGPKRKLKVSQPNKKHLPSGRFSCWPPASRPPPTPSQPRRWPSWCPPWWWSPPAAAGSPALTRWTSVVQGATATAGQIARLSCGTAESEQTHTHKNTHTPCLLLREGVHVHDSTFLNIFSAISAFNLSINALNWLPLYKTFNMW